MQKHWEVTVIWRSGFPSTVYIWTVNTVRASKEHSEMFQTLMEKPYYSWNVFLGAPDILCECWKIWSIFCLSISRDMRTKRQSAFVALLGVSTAVHKQEVVCAKKIVFAKRKRWRFEQRSRTPFTGPRIIFFWNATHHTRHVHGAKLIHFPH